MKKTLLLAGIATLFSVNVHAMQAKTYDLKPYVGMDYIYSYAEYKDMDNKPERSYNSIEGNMGIRMWKYFGPEFYYQYAFKRHSFSGVDKVKNRFYSYGMDMLGYMPIGCDGTYDAIASVGLGGYNVKTRHHKYSNDTNKVGYRFGLGMMYHMTDNLAARIMGRYNYIGTKYLDDIWEMTLGLRYSF